MNERERSNLTNSINFYFVNQQNLLLPLFPQLRDHFISTIMYNKSFFFKKIELAIIYIVLGTCEKNRNTLAKII